MKWTCFFISRLFVLGISWLALGSTTEAAEVCADKKEFVSVMQTCLIDKKQNVLYREKDKAQSVVIKELKTQNTQLQALIEKMESRDQSAQELIEALANDREERKQIEAGLREQLANRPIDWVMVAEVATMTLTARWGGGHLWRIGKKIMGR